MAKLFTKVEYIDVLGNDINYSEKDINNTINYVIDNIEDFVCHRFLLKNLAIKYDNIELFNIIINMDDKIVTHYDILKCIDKYDFLRIIMGIGFIKEKIPYNFIEYMVKKDKYHNKYIKTIIYQKWDFNLFNITHLTKDTVKFACDFFVSANIMCE